MTVGELKKKLESFPDEIVVRIIEYDNAIRDIDHVFLIDDLPRIARTWISKENCVYIEAGGQV